MPREQQLRSNLSRVPFTDRPACPANWRFQDRCAALSQTLRQTCPIFTAHGSHAKHRSCAENGSLLAQRSNAVGRSLAKRRSLIACGSYRLCGRRMDALVRSAFWSLRERGSWEILGGNESPGELESLRFIPKGWQRVAGGRSIAETTGMERNENHILKGCQKRWNDVRSESKRSGIPAGCTASFQSFRGSPLRCDPYASS